MVLCFFRESVRPFAPSILEEDLRAWFNFDIETPYMLFVSDVKDEKRLPSNDESNALIGLDRLKVKRSLIPAVTHVDYSARIQTVNSRTNPNYYELVKKFEAKTGTPISVNTSFNIRGEPIVQTPKDTFRCFMGTDIDILEVGRCFLTKAKQSQSRENSYRHEFELD